MGWFEEWVVDVRPRLARAFSAAYGLERGQEALAEAMAWAWEHADDLATMQNPAGYLYRVGQSRTRSRSTQNWCPRTRASNGIGPHHQPPAPSG